MLLLVSGLSGCQSDPTRATWKAPCVASPASLEQLTAFCHSEGDRWAVAEAAYAEALRREKGGDATCVDQYFLAAKTAWLHLECDLAQGLLPESRVSAIYQSALTKLISAGQSFCRFDPRQGLCVQNGLHQDTIPTQFYGFPWQAEDFEALVPVGNYATKELRNFHRQSGLGVAAVALRYRKPHERFRHHRQQFAATVALRRSPETQSFVLALYDPLRVAATRVRGAEIQLARDISAPIVFAIQDVREEYITGFLQPGSTMSDVGLFMTEPYQPGKIPVVFVHGLLSDPLTWVHLANEMRADPVLRQKYQIWGFEYPTGDPFLKSAAVLRNQLAELRGTLDPAHVDPAMSNMVLVGHSMGGLVAKLQVSHSGNDLWAAVANKPFPEVVLNPWVREQLAVAFFFEPTPDVSRVVFIGTPHRGSAWAQRIVGRLGATLVREPAEKRQAHLQVIHDNPGVFSKEFSRRIPKSIDMLRYNSPLLQAVSCLRISPGVQLHSIIGRGYCSSQGDSDGVVPVSSARHPGTVTEKQVNAWHGQIHKTPEGTEELFCILRTHLAQASQRPTRPGVSFTLPVVDH